MYLIMFGAPGVGKGTQAKILSDVYNIKHISTGDILRGAVRDETDLGKKAKEILERGELVPDDIMIGIIKDTLSKPEMKKGFILDGFPRTVSQADSLIELFDQLGIEHYHLIYLAADKEELVNRLTKRRACHECGTIFSLHEIEGKSKCPKCGAEDSFYQRDDDKEEVISNRLEVYRESTKPVLDDFRGKGDIHNVNAMGTVEEVNQRILAVLD